MSAAEIGQSQKVRRKGRRKGEREVISKREGERGREHFPFILSEREGEERK